MNECMHKPPESTPNFDWFDFVQLNMTQIIKQLNDGSL